MKHQHEPHDALSSATAFAPTISTERGAPGPELAAGTLVDHFKVVRLSCGAHPAIRVGKCSYI